MSGLASISEERHPVVQAIKGKNKLYEGPNFNKDGILSMAAVEILDSGCLANVSAVFVEDTIDLKSEVCM